MNKIEILKLNAYKKIDEIINAFTYRDKKAGNTLFEIVDIVRQTQEKTEEEIHEITNINEVIEVKRLSDNATLPTRSHDTDAGLDIYAAETIILDPQEKAKLATDIAVHIPPGYVGLLTSRSGISEKSDLVIETGKIDAGYIGHLGINIKNDAQADVPLASNNVHPIYDAKKNEIAESFVRNQYKINCGDKIAQLVLLPIVTPKAKEVEAFSLESERGENGFGSTGL